MSKAKDFLNQFNEESSSDFDHTMGKALECSNCPWLKSGKNIYCPKCWADCYDDNPEEYRITPAEIAENPDSFVSDPRNEKVLYDSNGLICANCGAKGDV